jgi:hypothetical protein
MPLGSSAVVIAEFAKNERLRNLSRGTCAARKTANITAEHIHQNSLSNIVAIVPRCDNIDAELPCSSVQCLSPGNKLV